jgi:hypothetical protein
MKSKRKRQLPLALSIKMDGLMVCLLRYLNKRPFFRIPELIHKNPPSKGGVLCGNAKLEASPEGV